MKRLFFTFLCATLTLSLMAEPTMNRRLHPHEIRLGYGDPLFETLVWHNSAAVDYGKGTENYRFTGHIMLEYQYRFNYWFSFGAQVDYQQVLWDETEYILGEKAVYPNHYFYDISLIPTMRFTYYHNYWVNLYSALGAGLLVNGGTEVDIKGRHVAFAPVINGTLLGVSVGKEYFFGSLELGAMTSLLNANTIYMVGSRLITASVGVRF